MRKGTSVLLCCVELSLSMALSLPPQQKDTSTTLVFSIVVFIG